jgi:hypothetical protein
MYGQGESCSRQKWTKGWGPGRDDMEGKEEELLIFVVSLPKYRLEPMARAIPGHLTPPLRRPSATDLEMFPFLSDSFHLQI